MDDGWCGARGLQWQELQVKILEHVQEVAQVSFEVFLSDPKGGCSFAAG